MPAAVPVKRATAFIDAQNLLDAANGAFGYGHPNVEPLKLATAAARAHVTTPTDVLAKAQRFRATTRFRPDRSHQQGQPSPSGGRPRGRRWRRIDPETRE